MNVTPPLVGDYAGIDGMGLIGALRLSTVETDKRPLEVAVRSGFLVRFSLEVDGREVAAANASRRFVGPGVTVQEVREGGLVGTAFLPVRDCPCPAVLVLGGSEGGVSGETEAALLASRGFVALALAYFGVDPLPQELREIPVEYVRTAIDWLLSSSPKPVRGVGLLGTSKGAEAALLVAANDPRVGAVVAYAPSSVVWSCICAGGNLSSWSKNGVAVPFVPPGRDPAYRPSPGFSTRPGINYRHRLSSAGSSAAIDVQRVNGPILLISGGDDQLWPSATMADSVLARLRAAGRKGDAHLSFEGAGHAIRKGLLPTAGSTVAGGGRLELGGSERGNSLAQHPAWSRAIETLMSLER